MADISALQEAYHWNITRIADAFGLHRDTVRKRLRAAGVVPAGQRGSTSVYALADVGPALYSDMIGAAGGDPDDLPPQDRKAWYQSETERVKLEQQLRLLVPVEDAHREMSRLAKAVASGLDSLADMLERDAGLAPESIQLVEQVTDALREQMYQAVIADDGESDDD